MSADFNQRLIRHYQNHELLKQFLESYGLAVLLYTDNYWGFYLQANKN